MIPADKPVLVFAFLLTVMVVILSLAKVPKLKRFFHYFPPLIWMYFIPMICTTAGIIPSTDCELYRLASKVALPAILVLLLVPSDTRSIAQLGPKAVGITLFGTLGTVCGATLSFWFFLNVLPEGTFVPEMWKGVASLSGSWIGGSPDFYAVAASLELESTVSGSTLLGKMIAVDTICCYSWLGVLVSLVAFEKSIDRFNKADSSVIENLKNKLAERHAKRARPITLHDVALMIGMAVVISQLCLLFGSWFDGVVQSAEGSNRVMKFLNMSEVVGDFGWGVLTIMIISVILSLTRVRNIEDAGASSIGYFGLYFLLTTIGAKADLNLITLSDIWLFVMGAVWLLIHISILMIGMRLLRVPFFLVATGSMANVGGTASAPVVAAAFHPTLASVGLMMGIFCGIIGTPISLLIVAKLALAIQGSGG